MREKKRLRIMSLSWRDLKSPGSGGAEVYTFELFEHADNRKYSFVHFSPRYKGQPREELIGHVRCIRKGNIVTVIFWAWLYYRKHRHEIDYVFDQCNTHRFFTRFWVEPDKRIFFIHQLTREIWDINMRWPWSTIGKILEPFFLRLQKDDPVLTVSESTKMDLIGEGFKKNRIYVIHNTVRDDVLGKPLPDIDKSGNLNFLFLGRYSRYKGIDVAVEAFGIVHEKYRDATLTVVGRRDEDVVRDVIMPIAERLGIRAGEDEECSLILKSYVEENEKYRLMREAKLFLFPSVREGWGITVMEAAALGTPTAAFDTPGCRDAVDFGRAGYLCRENTPKELARLMIRSIENAKEYEDYRRKAHSFVQQFTESNRQMRFNEMMEELQRCK